jgi:uncharacterized protein (DUF427 family)
VSAEVESIWDYPRPPIVVPSAEHVVIALDGEVVADTRQSLRVLETSHPPVYYVPADAITLGLLAPVSGTTFCEFKGFASYFDVVSPSGRVIPRAAWHYPDPTAGYEALVGHVAFYPAGWTAARSTTSQSPPSPATSTAAGSPAR